MPAQKKLKSLALYPSARTSAEWSQVDAAIRNTSFFSATIESEHVLANMKKMVELAMEQGLSMQEFTRQALIMLENISVAPKTGNTVVDKKTSESLKTLFDPTRLRLIFRTQTELAHGYAQTCEQFSDRALRMFPAWRFVRQPGAKESQKRPDHVAHENAVRLKTDVEFWKARNRPEIGGFGNPYGPWGFNSWMRTEEVSREECIDLGLIKEDEPPKKSAEIAEKSLSDVLSQIGTVSSDNFTAAQINRIINQCKAAGINVAGVGGSLTMANDRTIEQLQEEELAAWVDEQF